MKRLIALLICFLLIVTGTACANLDIPADIDSHFSNNLDGKNANIISLHNSWKFEDTLSQGSLTFTVTAANLLSSSSEEKLEIDYFQEHTFLPMPSGGDTTVIEYPNYLDSTGRLVDGCYLIALDISVESNGAMGNLYSDPYIFRADDMVYLINCELKDDGNYHPYRTVCYFSELGKCDEHSMAYRLEPGETISFTIGFLVNETWINNNSSLYGSLGISTKSVLIDLGINS